MLNKNYKYELEKNVNINIDITDILNTYVSGNYGILYILCYHINIDNKYPFIEFMLEKIPYCNNIVTEEFILPSIIINEDNIKDLENIIINKVFNQLIETKYNIENKNDIEYLGIIDNINYKNNKYVLVNINKIKNKNIELKRNTQLWLSIPTEIINNKNICNIPINKEVIELFENNFENLCLLYNTDLINLTQLYPLPYIVYSINSYNECRLENLFGRFKNNIDDKGFYLSFYRDYNNIKKHKLNNINNINNKELGINRYIIFLDDYITLDYDNLKNMNLNDYKIMLVSYNIVLLQNTNKLDSLDFDIIIKDYDNIGSVSYHKLTKEHIIV
jgi:hypothetical protein